jgi:hypothetical protein
MAICRHEIACRSFITHHHDAGSSRRNAVTSRPVPETNRRL